MAWICPGCGRHVPTTVVTCRCGHEREPDAQGADPTPPPRAGGLVSTAATVTGTVVAAVAIVIGFFYWNNRATPSIEAPRTTSTPAPRADTSRPEPMAAATPPPVATASVPAAAQAIDRAREPAAPATHVDSIADVVSRLLPAVVRVETPSAFGTGFFVRADTILTNVHVVQGNVSVTVRRASGDTVPARVENQAPELDIAVLHLDAPVDGQPTIPLGSGATARAGEEVLALGSPLGLQNTVTRGIVSAIRSVGGVTLVQTDAAINPGNSGGPLVDTSGRAIGITSLGMRSAVAQGLSFAVAIDHAADLLAGRRQGGSGTPLGNLTQAMRDSRTAVSEADAMREQASRNYEQALAQIARRADSLDDYWRRFRGTCYEGRIAGSFDREWFALFDSRAMQGAVSPGCGNAFADIRQRASEIRDQVLGLEEGARQADVYPGTRRDALRRYRLDYAGWDR